jgi:hypothetical protein
MKLLWTTDLHMDFCKPVQAREFVQRVNQIKKEQDLEHLDTGDLGTWNTARQWRERFNLNSNRFLLGNHDRYGDYKKDFYEDCTRVSTDILFNNVPILLADVSYGDGFRSCHSRMILNDWLSIGMLRFPYLTNQIGNFLTKWSTDLADQIKVLLGNVASLRREVVIVATHCPLFHAASRHKGQVVNEDGRPWYCNEIVGSAVLHAASQHPETDFLCLAGHTHEQARVWVKDNVLALTQGARYGHPSFRIIDIEEELSRRG